MKKFLIGIIKFYQLFISTIYFTKM